MMAASNPTLLGVRLVESGRPAHQMESPILPEELGGLATQLLRCILPDGKKLGLEKAKRAIRLDLSHDGVQRYIASTASHIPYQQALHVVVTSPLSVVAFPMTTEAVHFFRDVVSTH